MGKDHIQKIITGIKAEQAILPNSQEVKDLIREEADGRFKEFGTNGTSPFSSARRFEIQTDSGAIVTVHKDTGQTTGTGALASRFSRIGIRNGENEQHLDIIIDPDTSPFSPIYIFTEPKNGTSVEIGKGYGQGIETIIARELGVEARGYDGYVPQEVHEWIKDRLQSN